MEDMQRELASKQVRAQSITALRSVIVQKKLDEVLRMLKAAAGGVGRRIHLFSLPCDLPGRIAVFR